MGEPFVGFLYPFSKYRFYWRASLRPLYPRFFQKVLRKNIV